MNMHKSKRVISRNAGFTLIELMIVVAVIGILAAIGYPSYTNYLIKSSRSSAQGLMMSIASKEEQFLLDTRAYVAIANTGEVLSTLKLSMPDDVSRFYTITVTLPTSTSYLITANPIAGTRQAGDGTLTLDNTGAKAPADKWK